MASSTQLPPAAPQVPPPPPRQPRSIAGPVILIILGIVFLMGTMGLLNWQRLGTWFAHFWPVLIIIWGVIKLVEYQSAQRQGIRPRGIGVGGVFLLIFLIVSGLIATQATRFNWGELKNQIDIDDEDIPFFGHAYSYDDQMQQAWPQGANTLHIVNDHGSVNLSASDDAMIHVSVQKKVRADNQQDADNWNTGTKPQINVSGQSVTINANTQGAGDHWVAADLQITVPRAASVNITNRRGNVSVLGRTGDVQISNQNGEVTASDVTGGVSLSGQHTSARINQVSSDVSVEGRMNEFSAEDVKGSVRMNGEFVDGVRLARIGKSVTFRSSRTSLELAKLDGDLDLDSDDLRVAQVTGPIRVGTRSKDVRFEGVDGEIRIEDERGDIEVRVQKLGNIQVDSRRSGDVSIYVPDKTGFQAEMRSRGGEVQSDFSQLKIENGESLATATGSVGSGAARIVVNNEHGTISLRRNSSNAEVPEPPKAPKAPKLPARDTEEQPTEQ